MLPSIWRNSWAKSKHPQLTILKISFLSPERVVQLPELAQFICRAEYLKFAKFRRAHIDFQDTFADISFDYSEAGPHPCSLDLKIEVIGLGLSVYDPVPLPTPHPIFLYHFQRARSLNHH